jgi:predicted DNA-binding transcriptional regulator AlpA
MAKLWKCTCTDPTRTIICVVCAAAMTGYKPSTIYNKAEAREIPSVPLSKRKRVFYRESLAYWLKGLETGLA